MIWICNLSAWIINLNLKQSINSDLLLLLKLLKRFFFLQKYLFFQVFAQFILLFYLFFLLPIIYSRSCLGNNTTKVQDLWTVAVSTSWFPITCEGQLTRCSLRPLSLSLSFGFAVSYCDSFFTQSNLISRINDVSRFTRWNLNKPFPCDTRNRQFNNPPLLLLSAPLHSLGSSVQIKCLKDVFKKSLRGQTQLFWRPAPHRSTAA